MTLFASSHVLIVIADFYKHIAQMQLDGAISVLNQKQVDYKIITVPGALEIPSVIAIASETFLYDGYIALGCVIRGETSHYDTVCNESARGLMDLGIQKNIPIGNGILTVETEAQALVRADKQQLDKAGQAASACLTLIDIFKDLKTA